MDIQNLTDSEVVIKVKIDKELYREIIRRYQKSLFRYAFYLISDQELASDIVQQAFIKAYVNLNSFDLGKKFSSWIYRITHNEAINIMKKQKYSYDLESKLDLADSTSVEAEFDRKELRKQVKQCLNELSPIYREVLSLYYLQELKYDEISDILRIPVSTVGVRLGRAKNFMRSICQNQKI